VSWYRSHTVRLAMGGFAAALLLAWCCYRPALGGAFQLDDVGNLSGLARVHDATSTLDFVLGGNAGPLGRPLALLTFAWQADSWSQGAAPFLHVNIAIHLINAVLVAAFLLQLALGMRIEPTRAVCVAALSASAWVLMPLLATATLLTVQRMATLSASFMLLGLIAYLAARAQLGERPRQAIVGMSASLSLATLLAILCKESGLLLPVLVLVLELTLLTPPDSQHRLMLQRWRRIFLGVPLLAVLLYLVMQLSYPDWLVLRRDFNAAERLMSEAQILWIYLFKALLGVPHKLGIFQDPPSIARSIWQPLVLLATISWVLLLSLAIRWRRRYPLAAFAVLWFFAAHLLESTIVPLELYFEHRNYIAILGPLFSLCAAIINARGGIRNAATAGLVLAVLVNAGCLYVFAAGWGEPSWASRQWAMRYPDSARAVTSMATYQLSEEGPTRTLRTIDEFVLRNPRYAYLRVQELNLLCRYRPDLDRSAVLHELQSGLPQADFSYTAGNMLSQLFDASIATDCPGVGPETVAGLAQLLHDNPRYAGDPGYNQFHEKLLAAIARYQGDLDTAIAHVRAAIGYQPSSELNMMMVTALAGAGDFAAARDFIENAAKAGPLNPIRAWQWQRDLRGLRLYTDELEKVQQ